MSETSFADLQADVKARLDGDKFLGGVPVLIEDKGDILADLNQALAVLSPASTKHFSDGTTASTKVGICALVRMPVGLDDFPDTLFGPLDFDLDVTVIENPVLNEDAAQGGSGLRALVVARRVYRLLKNYLAAGVAQNLTPRKQCIQPTEEFAPLPAYNVMFSTREADLAVYQKCATPIFAPAGGLASGGPVALSCATPGAVIYWSADGSHPSPAGGGDVLLYGGPFAVVAGRTYRAAAFTADPTAMMESDVAAAIFT